MERTSVLEMNEPTAEKKVLGTVMLIDDNEIDNFINQKMIEGCGFATEILIYTSSRTALESLKDMDTIPAMIFLDINMPIMDGFQFMEAFAEMLNADEKLRNIRIIMLSTSINPSDIERAESNPLIERFINKPLTSEHLSKLI